MLPNHYSEVLKQQYITRTIAQGPLKIDAAWRQVLVRELCVLRVLIKEVWAVILPDRAVGQLPLKACPQGC